MVNLAVIRNSAFAIALGLLAMAEFLHPAFHNQSICFWQESQCLTGRASCLVQDDAAGPPYIEHACPICSSGFLKYCASDSTPVVLCDYQDTAVLSPLPDLVFVEINLSGFPRAPHVVFS